MGLVVGRNDNGALTRNRQVGSTGKATVSGFPCQEHICYLSVAYLIPVW